MAIMEESAMVLLDMESPIILSDMDESAIIFPDIDESAIILSAGIESAIMPSAMGGFPIMLSEMRVFDMSPSIEELDISEPMDFLGISPGMQTSLDFLDLNIGILKQVNTLFMVRVLVS